MHLRRIGGGALLANTSFVATLLATTILVPGASAAERPSASSVSVPRYESALQTYKAFRDEPVRPWREVNDEVAQRGGWREYARESAQARDKAAK